MEVSENDKRLLADLIIYYIRKDFEIVHLSKNLVNTIRLEKTNNGYAVIIPAEMYDISQFRKKGVVVHNNKGSYANEIDSSGGFSGQHKNYVDRAINSAIQNWLGRLRIKAEVKKL